MGGNPKGRRKDLVIQKADDELLIYDVRDNRAFCLNETSALVWESCDGNRDIDDIARHVSARLNRRADADLVWLALDQLRTENLLDGDFVSPTRFAGMSRREVIQKVGIGSMVALPLVASIIAPQAALAQTACGTVAACDCGNNGNTATCGQQQCTAGCTCYRTAGGASAGTCRV